MHRKHIPFLILLIIFLLQPARDAAGGQQTASIPIPDPFLGKFLLPGWTAEKVYHAPAVPEWVRTGPNNEILFRSGREVIYKVEDSGTLSVYKTFEPDFLEAFDFDSTGRLWMTSNSGAVWRMNDSGQPERVTPQGVSVNPFFAMDTQDNLIAVGSDYGTIQRITPGGQISTLVEGMGWLSMPAVGAKDEIAVIDTGNGILSVFDPTGQLIAAIPGFPEIAQDPVFSPDGELYVIGWSGLYHVDVQNKTSSKVTWFDKYLGTGDTADFDHLGRLVTWHANIPIFRFDLDAQTAEMVYYNKTNTSAMAVSPDGELYVAHANLFPIPYGETTVFRAVGENTLEAVVTVPLGRALALAFAPDGTGYVSAGDIDAAGKIYKFDPQAGTALEVAQTNASSLAVDPTTGDLWWWGGGSNIYFMNGEGQMDSVSTPDNLHFAALGFTSDGVLYAGMTFEAPGPFDPMTRGVYRRETNGSWTEIWTNTPAFRFTGLIGFGLCADGTMYISSFVDGNLLPDIPETHSFMLLQLSPQGELSPAAYDIPYDGFVVSCDWNTDQVYVTSYVGVTKYYQWAAGFIYLPLVLKSP